MVGQCHQYHQLYLTQVLSGCSMLFDHSSRVKELLWFWHKWRN